MTSGIDIGFTSSVLPSVVFSTLKNNGWGFLNNTIVYEHFVHDINIGHDKSIHVSEWENLLKELDDNHSKGEQVGINFYWFEDLTRIYVSLRQDNTAGVFLDGSRKLIPESRRFTDFSWFVYRIAVPLVENGCCLLSIECSDDML